MKLLKYLLGLSLIWFIVHCYTLVRDNSEDKNTDADVTVAFGSKVNTDSTLSIHLKAHLDQDLLSVAETVRKASTKPIKYTNICLPEMKLSPASLFY